MRRKGKTDKTMKRPRSVTAISWLSILSLPTFLIIYMITRRDLPIADSTDVMGFGYDLSACVLLLVCGLGMLSGRDWARWIFWGVMGLGTIITLTRSLGLFVSAGNVAACVAVPFLLSRPRVNTFFDESRSK